MGEAAALGAGVAPPSSMANSPTAKRPKACIVPGEMPAVESGEESVYKGVNCPSSSPLTIDAALGVKRARSAAPSPELGAGVQDGRSASEADVSGALVAGVGRRFEAVEAAAAGVLEERRSPARAPGVCSHEARTGLRLRSECGPLPLSSSVDEMRRLSSEVRWNLTDRRRGSADGWPALAGCDAGWEGGSTSGRGSPVTGTGSTRAPAVSSCAASSCGAGVISRSAGDRTTRPDEGRSRAGDAVEKCARSTAEPKETRSPRPFRAPDPSPASDERGFFFRGSEAATGNGTAAGPGAEAGSGAAGAGAAVVGSSSIGAGPTAASSPGSMLGSGTSAARSGSAAAGAGSAAAGAGSAAAEARAAAAGARAAAGLGVAGFGALAACGDLRPLDGRPRIIAQSDARVDSARAERTGVGLAAEKISSMTSSTEGAAACGAGVAAGKGAGDLPGTASLLEPGEGLAMRGDAAGRATRGHGPAGDSLAAAGEGAAAAVPTSGVDAADAGRRDASSSSRPTGSATAATAAGCAFSAAGCAVPAAGCSIGAAGAQRRRGEGLGRRDDAAVGAPRGAEVGSSGEESTAARRARSAERREGEEPARPRGVAAARWVPAFSLAARRLGEPLGVRLGVGARGFASATGGGGDSKRNLRSLMAITSPDWSSRLPLISTGAPLTSVPCGLVLVRLWSHTSTVVPATVATSRACTLETSGSFITMSHSLGSLPKVSLGATGHEPPSWPERRMTTSRPRSGSSRSSSCACVASSARSTSWREESI
mmetsp:Transcript_8795/g.29101  ORF Transcript_8795/g.29101 Transcript_8795/m.29101 type:complete len:769 (-) Transcript_8795:65-2371(-)